MSDQLYTQEQIVNHIENNSPTKFMYSFGRAPRFPKINRVGKSDALYVFPQIENNSSPATAIGFGNRSDFTKRSLHTEIAGPKRDYDEGGKSHGYAYSFGLARDKFTKAYCPGYKNIDKNVPGPAKYNIIKELGLGVPKYTLHGTKGESNWLTKNVSNPGPGAYGPVVQINKDGRYPISKCANTKGICFGMDKTDRFANYRCNIYFII